jgi:hypothetical protein
VRLSRGSATVMALCLAGCDQSLPHPVRHVLGKCGYEFHDSVSERIVSYPENGLQEDTIRNAISVQDSAAFSRVEDVKIAGDLLLVLEGSVKQVLVYTLSGHKVGSFGGPGAGPGEFGQPTALAIGPSNSVYVLDIRQQRFAIFDSTYHFVRNVDFGSRGLTGRVLPWPMYVDKEGNIYVRGQLLRSQDSVQIREVQVGYLRIGEAAVDTLLLAPYLRHQYVPSANIEVASALFEPSDYFALLSDEALVTGYGYTYDLCVSKPGEATMRLHVSQTEQSITPSDRAAERELRETQPGAVPYDKVGFPDHRPAFSNILTAGDSLILVGTSVRDPEVSTYDVVSRSGRLLRRLRLLPGSFLTDARSGYLAGVRYSVEHIPEVTLFPSNVTSEK